MIRFRCCFVLCAFTVSAERMLLLCCVGTNKTCNEETIVSSAEREVDKESCNNESSDNNDSLNNNAESVADDAVELSMDNEGMIHKCEWCQKLFTSNWHLKTHVLIHTGQKPFSCSECGWAFSQLGNLRAHERTHSGEKPYPCRRCTRKFTRPNLLKQHLEKIHGVRVRGKFRSCTVCGNLSCQLGNVKILHKVENGYKCFGCVYCERTFQRRDALRLHHHSHAEITPLTCDQCGKTFSLLRYLQKHAERRHNILIPNLIISDNNEEISEDTLSDSILDESCGTVEDSIPDNVTLELICSSE